MDTTGGVSMPKRAHAVPKLAVLAGSDPLESMESRRRRHAPPAPPPAAQHALTCAVTHTAPSTSTAASPVHNVVRPPSRMDAPVMHPTRRGSKAKAAVAMRSAVGRAWRNRFRVTHGQSIVVDPGSIDFG